MMGLTTGAGPFGERPHGRFDFDPPPRIRYVEPTPRRVRAEKNGNTVADSRRVQLFWTTGAQPQYAFPSEDVSGGGGRPVPGLEGYVSFPWKEMDAWFEEDEQVHVHVRDPYSRIDVLETTSHVTVALGGRIVAEGSPKILFETGLPPRYYFAPADVRLDLLTPSDTESG
jgi:uncharacterized protein (DUF427 family)